MNFVNAQDFDFSLLQAFLEPWESTCVTLCSYVRKKKLEKMYVIIGDPEPAVVPEALEGPKIKGLLFLDKTLLYCIPNSSNLPDLLPALTVFLKDKTVSCLN